MANTRFVVYGGVLVIAVIGFVMTAPKKDGGIEANNSRPARGSSSSSSRTIDDQFTEEDANAVFAEVNETLKNAFRPLVVPESGRRGALNPNEIPASFADGKDVWIYTGTAIIDEAPLALVENPTDGSIDFLAAGSNWKRSSVVKITPTQLTLRGPNGDLRIMDLMKDPPDPNEALLGFDPLSPLSGAVILEAREEPESTQLASIEKQGEKDNELE